MLKLWRGPIALAMFIPFKARTRNGDACRQRMIDYVIDMNEGMDTPFALSFLYPNEDSISLHCSIDKTSTGLERAWIDRLAWRDKYYDRDYLDMYDDGYPINDVRNLAVNQVSLFTHCMICRQLLSVNQACS